MGEDEEMLRIGDGGDWHFVNGDWVDGEDGLLSVPDDLIRSQRVPLSNPRNICASCILERSSRN